MFFLTELMNAYFEFVISQKVDVLCGIGINKVACGTQFSVALTKDGNVYTFGQGTLWFDAFFPNKLNLND